MTLSMLQVGSPLTQDCQLTPRTQLAVCFWSFWGPILTCAEGYGYLTIKSNPAVLVATW